MKFMKKTALLFLCLVLIAAISVSAFAANDQANVYGEVTADQVEVGGTVTLTLYIKEMTAEAFKGGFYFDNTKLQVEKITWSNISTYSEDDEDYVDSTPLSKTAKKKANEDGSALGVYVFNSGVDSPCQAGAFVTVKFNAIAEGEATITLREETEGTNKFKSDSVEILTVTIGNPEPEHTCTAGAVSYVQGTNGQHTKIVACADENCQLNYSETVEDCSGGTADCENAPVCANCGNTYGEAKGHGKTAGFRYVHNSGANTHDVICGDCGKTVEEKVACTFEQGSHVCKFACGNKTDCKDAPNDGNHSCDICGKENITDHDFNNAEHKCECGEVEKFKLTIKYYTEEDLENGNDWPIWSTLIVDDVPFGAPVKNYMPGGPEHYHKTDSTFTPNGKKLQGTYTIFWADGGGGLANELDPETLTMPADDFEIYEHQSYTGWLHTYDNDVLQGTGYAADGANVNGWQKIDGAWYYIDPATNFRAEGLTRVPYPVDENEDPIEINGITYGPNAEDLAYWEANADSKYTDAETAMFIFDEDGKFQQTTGKIGNSYAVNGMIGWHVGLVEIDGEYYYFVGDENGNGGNIMATGKVYATRNTTNMEMVKGGIYYFGEDGKLINNEGIVEMDEKLWYFENNRLMIGAGLKELDEGFIYVRSNGQLATGQYWVTTTNGICDSGMYTFGEDGFLTGTKDPDVNGIVDGYYYKNGKPYYAGLIEIDGDIYYVNSSGKVITGTYYITKTNDMEGFKKGDKLNFGADGKLVTE